MPVVPRVRLVHGCRGDRRPAVVGQPLLDLLLGRVVRRVGDVEAPDERRLERGRGEIGRDGEHGPLERRRRHHLALLPVGQRDEPVLGEERPSALGALRVPGEHLLGRGRVVVVDLVEHGPPVVRAAHLVGDRADLGLELGVDGAAALAQPLGVHVEQLAFEQQPAIALGADRVRPGAGLDEALEQRQEALVGERRLLARLGKLRRARRCPRPPPATAPGSTRQRAPAGADGALCEDGADPLGVEVLRTVGEDRRHRPQPGDRVIHELGLGGGTAEEEGEHAHQPGVEVGLGVAAPQLPVAHDLPAAQVGEHGLAVDALVLGSGRRR